MNTVGLLHPISEVFMFCPQCGAQNDDTNKYCTECGKSLALGFHQPTSTTKPLLPGVACHYSGCTEPVIGQCPGYEGRCLRYYCAKHSAGGRCSICVEKADAEMKPSFFRVLFSIILFLWRFFWSTYKVMLDSMYPFFRLLQDLIRLLRL